MTTTLTEKTIDAEFAELDTYITIEDFDALTALPVDTRVIDSTGDLLIVTGHKDMGTRVEFDWVMTGPWSRISRLDYDAEEAEEQILPAIVLNPEILGDFAPATYCGFEVGARVWVTEDFLQGWLGRMATVCHPDDIFDHLIDSKVPTMPDDHPQDWDGVTYFPPRALELVVEPEPLADWELALLGGMEEPVATEPAHPFKVGDRVAFAGRPWPFQPAQGSSAGDQGTVTRVFQDGLAEDSRRFRVAVELDTGEIWDDLYASRFDLAPPAEPLYVQAESLPVVMDLEALASLRDGSIVVTGDSYTAVKVGDQWFRFYPMSHGSAYNATSYIQSDVRHDERPVQVLFEG